MWNSTRKSNGWDNDEWAIPVMNIFDAVVEQMTGFTQNSTFAPLLQAATNTSYYGSKIVGTKGGKYSDKRLQYNQDTAQWAIKMGKWFGVSPAKLQYVVQQYTGWLGTYTVPMLDKMFQGDWKGVLPELGTTVEKKFTTDPLVSNEVVGAMYDNMSILNDIGMAYKDEKEMFGLRYNLTPQKRKEAGEKAGELYKTISSNSKQISKLYTANKSIDSNDTLTRQQKYEMKSVNMKQIISLALQANRLYAKYKEEYMYNDFLHELLR